MLERALGPGQAVVRVAAEINWDTITRTEETFDPDSQVARSTTLNDETTTSTTDPNGGAAGVASNVANADTNGVSVGASNNSQTKKKVTQSQYELSRVMSNTMLAAGGIKRLSAAVFIAQKMEVSGTDRKPVARTDEEIQKLKRIVQSALGIQEGDASRKDEITVEQIPFNDQPAIELSQRLESDGQRQFYWEIGRNVFFALLALGMLVVFLKLLKKTSGEIPVSLPADHLDNAGGSRRQPPGMVTVEALNSLIRENPASVGQAVRSWLGTGGKSN